MKIEIHSLFEYLLKTTAERPEAVIGFSLSRSPTLKSFIDDLDPDLSLDWNNRSFYGLPELREHVLRQANLADSLSIDNVLITAGAAEANYLALRQLLEPGDELITEAPGWPQAAVLAKGMGVHLHSVHRHDENGWSFPMQELASAINDRTRMIFVSNPNNPTGRLLSVAELEDIVGLARPRGIFVVVDEVYAGLEWHGQRMPSIAGLYERGITTGSVSKTLGLQGLRTGWMISPDQSVIRDALILRENSSEIMNIMGEAIAEIALRPGRFETAIESARAEGQANLALLDSSIEAEECLSWRRPDAGLMGLARLAGGIDGDELSARLLEQPYRTFLIPGSVYELPRHIRLGVGGGPDVRLDEGLRRLSACLRTMSDE